MKGKRRESKQSQLLLKFIRFTDKEFPSRPPFKDLHEEVDRLGYEAERFQNYSQ